MTVPPWLDPRTAPARCGWLAPLVDHLVAAAAPGGRSLRLLDYGCGDLQLATLLPDRFLVDGFDHDPLAREAARSHLRSAPRAGQVWDDPCEIPAGAYDGVVLASVLQYLPDADAVGSVLHRAAAALDDGAELGIVATDIARPGRHRVGEAADTLRYLLREVGWVAVGQVAAASTRAGPGAVHTLSDAEVHAQARRHGLRADPLVPNLSPFRHRRSYAFHPISEPA